MLAGAALVELQTFGLDFWIAVFLKIMHKKFDHFKWYTIDRVAGLVKRVIALYKYLAGKF